METRNGVQFATFKVKLVDSHQKDKTSLESNKKKSPSTVKRDKERLEKFNKRKKLFQENLSLGVTSTPSSKYEFQEKNVSLDQDMVTQALDNKIDEEASDMVSKEPSDRTDFEKGQCGEDVIISKEDMKYLKNSFAERDKIMQDLNNMISKKDDKLEEDDDNIECAKLWALKQKRIA